MELTHPAPLAAHVAGGLSGLTLTDLVVAGALVLAVAGTLRRGGGLLAAVGSLLVTGFAAWLVVSALATWGPTRLAEDARSSALLTHAPPPTHALDQASRLATPRP